MFLPFTEILVGYGHIPHSNKETGSISTNINLVPVFSKQALILWNIWITIKQIFTSTIKKKKIIFFFVYKSSSQPTTNNRKELRLIASSPPKKQNIPLKSKTNVKISKTDCIKQI